MQEEGQASPHFPTPGTKEQTDNQFVREKLNPAMKSRIALQTCIRTFVLMPKHRMAVQPMTQITKKLKFEVNLRAAWIQALINLKAAWIQAYVGQL